MMDEYVILGMVVVVLGNVVGLFLSVGGPIIKLNSTITKLNTKMETMEITVNGVVEKNRDSHRRIHERIDDVENEVGKLDKRVQILENK